MLHHLYIKATDTDEYYTQLSEIFKHHTPDELGVSDSTLRKYSWERPYENQLIVLKRGELVRSRRPGHKGNVETLHRDQKK